MLQGRAVEGRTIKGWDYSVAEKGLCLGTDCFRRVELLMQAPSCFLLLHQVDRSLVDYQLLTFLHKLYWSKYLFNRWKWDTNKLSPKLRTSVLFSTLAGACLLAVLLFYPSRLGAGLSHWWSKVNRRKDQCWLPRIIFVKSAEQFLEVLHYQCKLPSFLFFKVILLRYQIIET